MVRQLPYFWTSSLRDGMMSKCGVGRKATDSQFRGANIGKLRVLEAALQPVEYAEHHADDKDYHQ